MTAVNWEAYQKCRACFAPLGKPCRKTTGSAYGYGLITDRPHSGRKLRAGYGR